MSAAAPDALDRIGESLAERASPIVIKEVRQGLRTRVFWVFFTLMLIACMVIALVAFAASASTEAGAGAFGAIFSVLGLVQFFVIPYSAYRSMAREQEDETWVLLTLTGLGPRSVIRGKIGSFVLQGVLYASAAAPFLLFSYYLNGIDLPTIVAGLVFAAAYQVFLVSVAVSLATVAHSKLMRGLMQFAVLAILLAATGLGMGASAGLIQLFRRGNFDAELLFGCCAAVFAMLSTAVLLFEAAAAGLSLTTESYARGHRLAYLVQLFGGVAFFIQGWHQMASSSFLIVGAVLAAVYSTLVGTYVISDRDGLAANLRAKRSSVFTPGAYRGYLLVAVSLIFAGAVFLALASTDHDLRSRDLRVIVAAPAFALFYLSLPQVVARWLPHAPTQTPAMVRVVSLGLLVLGMGLPPLVGLLISEPDDKLLNLLNPLLGLVNLSKSSSSSNEAVVLVWVAAAVAALMATLSLKRRDT